MLPRHIFTFWEPKDSMPAYLRLCLNTWKTNAPEFEVTLLDHSNLESYLDSAGYPMDRLFMLPLQIQKDAIEAAVLHQNGGIFMDVDTLVLSDFKSVLKELQNSEIVLFSNHLAFMAARPGADLLQKWVKSVREKLQNTSPDKLADADWDFAGNTITNSLFKKSSPDLVTQLNKNDHAFTPEILHFLNNGTAIEQYRDFWFKPGNEEAPFFLDQFLIALHNSWTPDWYKKLSEDDVLAADCLLSKTLKNLLNRNHHQMKKKPISIKIQAALFLQKIKKKLT